jgi:hypothetical protein
MLKSFAALLLLLSLQGCSDTPKPARQVQTSFSGSSGLTVSDSTGLSQQLIKESLGVRVVASENGQWLLVEDMQLSNLVVVRAFQYRDGSYREASLPGIRQQWQSLAQERGLAFEDLMHPRVGVDGFGIDEKTVLLHLRADTGLASNPEIDSIVEISLD